MSASCEDLTTDAVAETPRSTAKQSLSTPNQSPSDPLRTNSSRVKIEEMSDEEFEKPKTKTRASATKPRPQKSNIVNGTVINVTKSSYVRIGTDVHYNFSGNSDKPKQAREVPLTIEIEELFQSTDKLTQDHLDFFSSHVGERWKTLGRKLQYSQGQLEQFEIDGNGYGIKETIFQMLLDWTRVYPEIANVGCFCKILWRCDIKDVVQRLTMHNFTKL